MFIHKAFPYALAVGVTFNLLTAVANGQSEDVRPRRVTSVVSTTAAITTVKSTRLENDPVAADPVIVSLAEADEARSPKQSAALLTGGRLSPHFNQLLQAAIDMRLGTPYVYGAAGPASFDCSGFVWAVFQSAGMRFGRTSASALWTQFPPASKSDERRFGTLVFFNDLAHVGIVADEHGFYHASRSQGVTYSLFDDYWLDRLDGFRHVPLPAARPGE